MNPFTPEQLTYLQKNFAPLPHTHLWTDVLDTDGQSAAEAFENVDAAIAALDEESDEDDDDEGDGGDDDDETTG